MSAILDNQSPGIYRSGVAARLSGVPVATLRIWERRYSVVGPQLSSGRQRLYSSADIRRLTLIKQLVDMGHPIGSIASLDYAALCEVRDATRAAPPVSRREPAAPGSLRVAIVGLLGAASNEAAFPGGHIRIVARCPDPGRALDTLSRTEADLVVVELPTLADGDEDRIAAYKGACRASGAVVLYRFAPSAVVRRLRGAGHAVARSTPDPVELEALCRSVLGHAGTAEAAPSRQAVVPAEAPPPRFDEQTLASLQRSARSIECECPRHLVGLVMDLASFERYSAQCASRNPADVALHLDLQRAAGVARSIVEQALERVAQAEGMDLPPRAVPA